MTYAVTGASGAFGTLAVRSLIARGVSPASVVAVLRDPAKAAALKALGVQIRQAAYEDQTALRAAFAGVDRLLMVSGSEVGKRASQHRNVLLAAGAAGVKLLAYTSIANAALSANPLAPEHKATEEAIKASGIPYVFLRNNWYTENYAQDFAYARTSGVLAAAAGKGRVASAARADLAEAAAVVLTGKGHEGRTYELGAGASWSYAELAAAMAAVAGRPVAYVEQTPAERGAALRAAGLPEGIADFVVSLDAGIAAGTLDLPGGDLAKLLGREPLGLEAAIRKF